MILRLKNITFREYLFELKESEQAEYNFAAKFGNVVTGSDVFGIGEFSNRSFGFVKDAQALYGNVDIDGETFFKEFTKILNDWLHIDENRLLDIPVFDYFNTLSFFAKQVQNINIAEESLISTIGEPVDESAESFARFGVLAQYLDLANNDITKIKDVEKLEYLICFSVLLYRKEQYEYQYRQSKKRIK